MEERLYLYDQLYWVYQEITNECLFCLDLEREEFIYSEGEGERGVKRLKTKGILEGLGEKEGSYSMEEKQVFIGFLKQLYYEKKYAELEFQSHGAKKREGRWFHLEGSPVLKENGGVTKIIGRGRDVSRQVMERLLLEQRAEADTLTGLCNQAVIMRKMDVLLECKQDFAILLIDVDNFKEINENYGQWYGDFILGQIADIIKACAQEPFYAGRLRNDRYILLLLSSSRNYIAETARAVQKGCQALTKKQNLTRPVTVSIGITRYPWCGKTREVLLHKAEAALNHIKLTGKNSFAFFMEVEGCREKGEDVFGTGSREGVLVVEEDIVQMVKKTLSGTRDFEKTMNNILEMVAVSFALDKASILEYDISGESIYCSYQWAVPALSMEKKEYLAYSKTVVGQFFEEYRVTGGEVITDDIEQEDMSNIYRFSMRHKGIKAAVHYATFLNGYAQYGFQYEMYSEKRRWTQKEREMLREISGVLADALSNRKPKTKVDEFMDRFVNYDRLTTLFTFTRFLQEAQLLRMSHSKDKFVLLYTDFRDFKYINDAFGYKAGDSILCNYAAVLKERYNRVLGYACRITNDCFTAISIYESEEVFLDEAYKIRRQFIERIQQEYPGINLILDTGIYFVKPEDELSNAVDNANYARKMAKTTTMLSEGVVFDQMMQKRLWWESQMLNSMDSALKNEEFKVFYQPKVSLADGRIIGAEALIRWQKDNGDIAYPDQFIPFCEEHGIISKLDYFVLEKTCQTIRAWMDGGSEPICISVNLSRIDCLKPGFFERIMDMVDSYGIPHRYIEFEVTESIFTGDLSTLQEFLHNLREAEFEVSMDDFGSGYSSLNILPEMPVTIIKLDRDFWKKETGDNKKRMILLEKVIETIRLMGFKIICEGIEMPEQAAFCKEIGCEMAQGYLFGKPMELFRFNGILEENRKSR